MQLRHRLTLFALGALLALPQSPLHAVCVTSWSTVPIPFSTSLREMSHDGAGTYVIAGDPGSVLRSTDLTNWTSHSAGTDFRGMTYANGQFVGSGVQGAILTSPDGATWTSQNSGTAEHLGSIAYALGRFVVVGNAGTIVTSTDAINWTSQPSGTSAHLHGVTFGDGLFVATGLNGTILTSPDGLTWTSRTSGTSSELYAFIHAAGLYIVVGDYGTILTSSDAVTWTSQASGTSSLLHAIAYGNGLLVVAGDLGTIVTSTDGTNWSAQASGSTNLLLGASFVDDEFFIVGHNGTILRSSCPPPPPTYACNGFHAPLANGPVVVRGPRTLPVKATLDASSGAQVAGADLAAWPTLRIVFTPLSGPDQDVTNLNSDDEFDFRGSHWHLNLSTRPFDAPGTYTLTMASGDPAEYTVAPGCSGSFVVR